MTNLPTGSPPQALVALMALPGAQGSSVADAWSISGVPVVDHAAHASSLSDEILAACQSNWWAPPEYLPRWELEPEVAALAARQWERANASVGGTGTQVWWDQRHPLLIDLWLMPGRNLRAAVLLWDTPEQSVNALQGLGIRPVHAVALWEHATLHALAALVDQNVYVCHRRELSTGVPESLLTFLSANGIDVSAVGSPVSAASLDTFDEGGLDDLLSVLESVSGPHDAFPTLVLPPMSAASSELLAAHRAAHRMGIEAREAWLLADRREREAARIQAELNSTVKGVDRVAAHLLNVLGAP
jgi:hypothetical protein